MFKKLNYLSFVLLLSITFGNTNNTFAASRPPIKLDGNPFWLPSWLWLSRSKGNATPPIASSNEDPSVVNQSANLSSTHVDDQKEKASQFGAAEAQQRKADLDRIEDSYQAAVAKQKAHKRTVEGCKAACEEMSIQIDKVVKKGELQIAIAGILAMLLLSSNHGGYELSIKESTQIFEILKDHGKIPNFENIVKEGRFLTQEEALITIHCLKHIGISHDECRDMEKMLDKEVFEKPNCSARIMYSYACYLKQFEYKSVALYERLITSHKDDEYYVGAACYDLYLFYSGKKLEDKALAYLKQSAEKGNQSAMCVLLNKAKEKYTVGDQARSYDLIVEAASYGSTDAYEMLSTKRRQEWFS